MGTREKSPRKPRWACPSDWVFFKSPSGKASSIVGLVAILSAEISYYYPDCIKTLLSSEKVVINFNKLPENYYIRQVCMKTIETEPMGIEKLWPNRFTSGPKKLLTQASDNLFYTHSRRVKTKLRVQRAYQGANKWAQLRSVIRMCSVEHAILKDPFFALLVASCGSSLPRGYLLWMTSKSHVFGGSLGWKLLLPHFVEWWPRMFSSIHVSHFLCLEHLTWTRYSNHVNNIVSNNQIINATVI